jgi:hypothetical protein
MAGDGPLDIGGGKAASESSPSSPSRTPSSLRPDFVNPKFVHFFPFIAGSTSAGEGPLDIGGGGSAVSSSS